MTTETSNARGEVVLWGVVAPDGTLHYTSESKSVMEYETEGRDGYKVRPLIYGDAPPPAAARGDVRGLVAQLKKRCDEELEASRDKNWGEWVRDQHIGRYSGLAEAKGMIESALAAEGVQAGEVEKRARKLIAKLARHVRPTCSALWDEAESFLSQQPEARGVVDEARSERAWPVIGNLYLVKIGGVLQHEVFMFDQGDCEPGGSAPPFWSRDGLDNCPEFDPHKDQWIALDEIDAALTGERNG